MLFRSNDTATTEIYTSLYTLSLHDALPIYPTIARIQSEHIDAESGAGMGSSGRDTGCGVGAYVDKSGLRVGWGRVVVIGECAGCDRGEGRGRAEQRKELATSQAGRQRFLIMLGLFR